ncbi:hypothetical protein G9A89_019669 [Geosiphon pyriformis]|nr:hypothetical protein G9A89_019669 [Geosiphon pyriformis]
MLAYLLNVYDIKNSLFAVLEFSVKDSFSGEKLKGYQEAKEAIKEIMTAMNQQVFNNFVGNYQTPPFLHSNEQNASRVNHNETSNYNNLNDVNSTSGFNHPSVLSEYHNDSNWLHDPSFSHSRYHPSAHSDSNQIEPQSSQQYNSQIHKATGNHVQQFNRTPEFQQNPNRISFQQFLKVKEDILNKEQENIDKKRDILNKEQESIDKKRDILNNDRYIFSQRQELDQLEINFFGRN